MPKDWSALIGLLGASPALIGFLSGVGVSVVGAIITNWLSRKRERRKVVEERRFAIYMKLMDLYASYFLVSAAEVRGEKVRPEISSSSPSAIPPRFT